MYAILNDDWDGGWLELNPFYSKRDAVSKKERAIWTQTANYFKKIMTSI
jgi:endoglucanase